MAITQEKMHQLQVMEQSLQALLVQKQGLQVQLAEIESAVSELSGKEHAYKMVGSIMVTAKAADLLKDLESKKELLELHLKSVDRQEKGLREKAESLQQDVLKDLEKKK